ncbi:MAG: hypothetical protein AB7E76_02100 [Deferribacterales bacterium]
MSPLLGYIISNPLFGLCFVFYLIPFWVPILGITAGADIPAMLLLLLLTVMSKAYIDSEITFGNPVTKMLDYLLSRPFLFMTKLVFTLILLWVLVLYAVNGSGMDKGIAAVMMIFIIQVMYFRPVRSGFWQIKGLRTYRWISFGSMLLTAFLWLAFFGLDVHPAEKAVIGLTAMFISAVTFFKKNEGLV